MTDEEREFYRLPATADPPPAPTPDAESKPTGRKSRRKGSGVGRFPILNAFVDLSLRGLPDKAVKVWLILWRDTNAATGAVRTSYASVAERAGCCEKTVTRAVAALKRRGLLTVVSQGGYPHRVNVFRVAGGG